MEKQPDKKSVSAEEVDAINTKFAALAWENFLKRLGARIPEDKAREILIEELQELSTRTKKPGDIPFWDEPEKSVEKLKKYLKGELRAGDLKTYEELAGGGR